MICISLALSRLSRRPDFQYLLDSAHEFIMRLDNRRHFLLQLRLAWIVLLKGAPLHKTRPLTRIYPDACEGDRLRTSVRQQ